MSVSPSSPDDIPRMLAGTIVPTIIGTTFALARVYTRGCITQNLGKDDLFICLALAFAIVLTGLNCHVAIKRSQAPTINPDAPFIDDLIPVVQLSYTLQLVYQFTLWATKIGVCFFYIRIFDSTSTKWALYIVMGILTLAFIPIEFMTAFRCRPLSLVWDTAVLSSSQCLSNRGIIFASSIINIIGDFVLMAFVVPRFAKLHIKLKQKILLILTVSLGFLVVFAAIIRLVYIMKGTLSQSEAADIITWSAVEVYTGLFCASAPCIRPLIRKMAPTLLSSGGETKPSNTRGIYLTHRTSRHKRDAYGLNSSTEGFNGQTAQSSSWVAGHAGSADGADADDYAEKVDISKPELSHIRKTVQFSIEHAV